MRKRSLIPLITFTLFFLVLGTPIYKTTTAININYSNFSNATIYVDPPSNIGTVGQKFTVKINISNAVDLYGWEFKLGWNATILNATDVGEGSFLKSGGDTFFAPTTNNTAGYILVDCTLLGNIPGVNGNGTLATVEFRIETGGACDLDLYDTILVDSQEQAIQHTAIDGYFYTLLDNGPNAVGREGLLPLLF